MPDITEAMAFIAFVMVVCMVVQTVVMTEETVWIAVSTPWQTVSHTPLNHSVISPQCLIISTTATMAATTSATMPMIGRSEADSAPKPTDAPPAAVPAAAVPAADAPAAAPAAVVAVAVPVIRLIRPPSPDVIVPTAETTFPTPTRSGPIAAAMRAVLTMASCMPGLRAFHLALRSCRKEESF